MKNKIDDINECINKKLSFLDNPNISAILQIFIFWYVSKTNPDIKFFNYVINNPYGQIFILSIALWRINKEFIRSFLISTILIVLFNNNNY